MKQIAIYGKGGIGKSTVSANISYQLSSEGFKVAQIGCDPKHDSTRLLLGGKTQTTVLDHINSDSKDIGDTVSVGKNGILCIETGGPEPGVGCAGRGILTAFNFMENNSIVEKDTDIMLYDVLGDVVCGGFAVPLRRKYANAVFIVTSGEFMSLYAANNVLKGIRNFDIDKCRVAGLILNMRGNEGEYEYVKNFADAVGLPIVTKIPRSSKFAEAESEGVTVSEKFPDSEEYKAVHNIVEIIKDLNGTGGKLYPACPLNDDELDLIAKGKPVRKDLKSTYSSRILAVDERNVLRGCGSHAACLCCLGIKDADVIIHGPKSCHFFFSAGLDGGIVFENKAMTLRSASERMFSTDLTDYSSIFGGIKELGDIIESRIKAGTKTIFVVSTCVPGIIGDDVEGICERMREQYPDVDVVPIDVDGILNGGGFQAREMTLRRMCSIADKKLQPDEKAVNIIGYSDAIDKVMARGDDMHRLIEGLGLHINSCFLNDTSAEEFKNVRKGRVNLMYSFSVNNRNVCRVLESELGIPWFSGHMPIGLEQTVSWIRRFGEYMGVSAEICNRLIGSVNKDYDEFKAQYSGRLSGKKAVIYCPTATNIDWVLEMGDILGFSITDIYCPTNSKWTNADDVHFADKGIRMEFNINYDALCDRLDKVKPDMVIGMDQMLSRLSIPHYNFRQPRTGVRSAIECGKRIVRMMEVSII